LKPRSCSSDERPDLIDCPASAVRRGRY
jgi:hypothetical protein